jgi:cell division transport system permease protein
MIVTFFLKKNLSAAELNFIQQKIRSFPLITAVRTVSSDEALQRFQKNFPELRTIIENLKTNPFPPSLEAKIKEKVSDSAGILKFVKETSGLAGVEDVQFNRDWVEKMESLSRLARALGFFLGGILVLASFFIISNVIKLNVLARKNEIEILRLVGATNVFIRIPFLLEGILLGAMGSLVSLLFLLLVVKLFPLYLGSSLGALQELLSFRYLTFSQSISLLVAGGGIGFLGSTTSLSRFLKT